MLCVWVSPPPPHNHNTPHTRRGQGGWRTRRRVGSHVFDFCRCNPKARLLCPYRDSLPLKEIHLQKSNRKQNPQGMRTTLTCRARVGPKGRRGVLHVPRAAPKRKEPTRQRGALKVRGRQIPRAFVCSCSPPAQGPRGPWAGRQRGQESGEGAGAAALQRGQEREKRYHVDRENKTNTRFRGGAGGEAAFCDSTASRWMRKTQHESSYTTYTLLLLG